MRVRADAVPSSFDDYEIANTEIANTEIANIEIANIETANVETANVETANIEPARRHSACTLPNASHALHTLTLSFVVTVIVRGHRQRIYALSKTFAFTRKSEA